MVVPTIKALKDRDGGGYELLAYRSGRSGWADVKAAEINEYLKQVTGGDYSAKDFRTWNATVLAAVELAANGTEATTKAARKRAAAAATKRVATYLSNTPAVCRKAYIDPRVFDRFEGGETIRGSLKRMVAGTDPGEFVDRERIERAVLRLSGLIRRSASPSERRPEALLGASTASAPLADPLPLAGVRLPRPRSPPAAPPASVGPLGRGLGGERPPRRGPASSRKREYISRKLPPPVPRRSITW